MSDRRDPVATPAARGNPMTSGRAWTLIAVVAALAVGLAIWGLGGRAGDGTAKQAEHDGTGGAPVYGGAAPTTAPAPTSTGNGSNH